MIKEENVIPEIPFWIRKQLHKPCWNWVEIVKAIFSDKKERRIINHIKLRTGAREVILLDSGSSAIEQALGLIRMRSNLGLANHLRDKKNEVIMPSYCCKSVADCIINCGLIPHFVDVDDDFMVTINTIRKGLNKNTLAIIMPHMYGKNCFVQYAKEVFGKVPFIEDKAMRIQGKLYGDYGILSFNIGKQVQSIGGGALLIK